MKPDMNFDQSLNLDLSLDLDQSLNIDRSLNFDQSLNLFQEKGHNTHTIRTLFVWHLILFFIEFIDNIAFYVWIHKNCKRTLAVAFKLYIL